MAKTVLVTGATGNIGSMLVPKLVKDGMDVRAFVRDAAGDKAKALGDAGAKLFTGTFEKPETLKPALEGVDTLVLITAANANAKDQATTIIDAAKAAKVRKIVRISVVMPDERRPTDNVRQHAEADAVVKASGLTFTILRPHFFMQNLFMSAGSIGSEGKMYWGMGSGKLGMIDVRDIVDAAEKACIDDKSDNQIFQLTGPSAFSFEEAAKEIGTALEKDVGYVPVPLDAVEQSIKQMGMGDWFAKAMRDYSDAYANGWGDFVTEDFEKLVGKKPRSFRQFVREVMAPALKR